MKKYLLLLLFTLFLLSCSTTGGLSNFYKPSFSENDYISQECLLAEGEEPKIYYSDNISNDITLLRSNYYQILGYSSFNGPAQGDSLSKNVTNLSKEKRAKVAIYTFNFTDTRHGVSSSSGRVSSYNIKRYDYTIVLFVDLPKEYVKNQKTGFEIMDLDTESRQRLKRNTGVVVDIVYNSSPAFYANLIKDDVIIKINNSEMYESSNYYELLKKLNRGKKVIITVIRNGIVQKISYIL